MIIYQVVDKHPIKWNIIACIKKKILHNIFVGSLNMVSPENRMVSSTIRKIMLSMTPDTTVASAVLNISSCI